MILDVPKVPVTVRGFRFAGVACGLKGGGRRDVALIHCPDGARVAAAFTRNRFAAAPVIVAREHVRDGRAHAVLVNTKSANAGTGAAGIDRARAACRQAATALGVPETSIVPCSTGKIGLPIPATPLRRGIREAVAALDEGGFWDAADAIQTTDAFVKGAFREVAVGRDRARVAGMAKGAGMIHPDLATTLVFVTTDARVPQTLLRRMLADGLDASLNRATVDGDTSTNDTALLLSSGAGPAVRPGTAAATRLAGAVRAVLVDLARMLVADGEGATKLVEVVVTGARSEREARLAARAIATSVLVKTALAGADPNWGRIACAAGYSGADLDPTKLEVRIGNVVVARAGGAVGTAAERRARKVLGAAEVEVGVDLGVGRGRSSYWTSDLGVEYVRFNSEYSS